MMSYMSKRRQQKFAILLRALKDDNMDISHLAFAETMVEQYRKNRRFGEQTLHRYIVTANMSAGKSHTEASNGIFFSMAEGGCLS